MSAYSLLAGVLAETALAAMAESLLAMLVLTCVDGFRRCKAGLERTDRVPEGVHSCLEWF